MVEKRKSYGPYDASDYVPYTYTSERYNNERNETSLSSSEHEISNTTSEDENEKEDSITEEKVNPLVYYGIVAAIGVVLFAILFHLIGANKNPQKSCSYKDLELKYPNETKKTWQSLSIGLENIIGEETDKPGVYLFVHHNISYVREFVKQIAEKSSTCIKNGTAPVEMEKEQFVLNEDGYGHIIEKFKGLIKKSRVVLIGHLNEIPAETARALHFICDTYSPIDKKVIIFLTLVPIGNEGNPKAIAENTLINLWEDKLEPDELDALITRVTDEVIILKG